MMWKRWLLRTAGVVVLVFILRTAWLVGEREWRRSAGEKEYTAAVAETERTDPDWRWDDLNAKRARPPAGKNGADLISKVKALARPGWGQDLLGDRLGRLAEVPPNVRYPDAVLAEARRELDGSRAAVDLARTLKDYPDEGFRELQLAPNPAATVIEDTQHTRLVAAILVWDAAVAADDDRPERAADAMAAALNASRSIGDEPFLISQLVRMATRDSAKGALERVLAQTNLTDQQLAVLKAAWTTDAEAPILRYGLRGERVIHDTILARMADGTLTYTEGTTGASRPDPGGTFGQYAWWLYRGRLPRERAFLLRWFTLAVEAARRPIQEQPAAFAPLPFYDRYADSDPWTFDLRLTEEEADWLVARTFIKPTLIVARGTWRSAAWARAAAAGLACERFRLKHGRWPESLAELPKDLLAAVPLDPFDGKPLRFRRLADGIVIYSVGPNRADDGGSFAHEPNKPHGPDIGFRLWDPDHRRKPAPPAPPADEPPPTDPEEP